MAGWVTILGSAAIVITVFDLIANLRSIDTRERVQRVLSEPPLKGTGFDVQQVLDGDARPGPRRRRLRHRRGDPGRPRAAPQPAAPASGSPCSRCRCSWPGWSPAASCRRWSRSRSIMLWTRPARDWFDGRAPQRNATWPEPPAPEPPAPAQDRGPAAYAGFGTPGATPTDQAPPQQGQQPGQQQGQPAGQPGQPTGQVPPQQWPDVATAGGPAGMGPAAVAAAAAGTPARPTPARASSCRPAC